MTFDEALAWIEQVDGVLYQNPHRTSEPDAWLAVIRSPTALPGKSRVIVASGQTLQQAASAAEKEWNRLWAKLGSVH